MYIGKERRIRMADRRVNKTTDVRLCIPWIDRGAPFGSRIGVADRRAKTTNTDALTEGCPITPTVVEHTPGKTAQEKFDRAKSYNSGNSALLIEYREALIKAYGLGNHIKELYGIVPPKVIYNSALASSVYLKEGYQGVAVTISLTVN